jgi:carbon storage regulator
MLVLSRKTGQRILVGNGIAITVIRINSNSVRLGIDAPAELRVVREELIERLTDRSDEDAPQQAAAR